MPTDLTREECESEAATLLRRHDLLRLPVDPLRLAEIHGITAEGRPLDGAAGCLLYVGGAFGIVYSTSVPNDGFMRFSTAHELGHYFLPGHPDRLFGDGAATHFSSPGFVSRAPVERQADQFASGLLMPEGPFRAALRGAGEGLAAVRRLASTCSTSLTATAVRYAQLTHDAVAVVVSTDGGVEFSVISDAMREVRGVPRRLERGARVPTDGATAVAWRQPDVRSSSAIEGCTLLSSWFEDAADLEVTEEVARLGTYGRCVTILHLDEAPDEEEQDDDDE